MSADRPLRTKLSDFISGDGEDDEKAEESESGPEEEEEAEKPVQKPNWKPQSDDQTDTQSRVPCEAEGCNATVTKRFARVFGTNEDRIYACPECSTYREISGRENAYGTGVGPGGDPW